MAGLSHTFVSLSLSSITQTFKFVRCTKFLPTSGPLHMLLSMEGSDLSSNTHTHTHTHTHALFLPVSHLLISQVSNLITSCGVHSLTPKEKPPIIYPHGTCPSALVG